MEPRKPFVIKGPIPEKFSFLIFQQPYQEGDLKTLKGGPNLDQRVKVPAGPFEIFFLDSSRNNSTRVINSVEYRTEAEENPKLREMSIV